MKTIDVKEQHILSFGRTVGITLNGIRYRLFRSAVTVVVMAVAIAFLMNILSESVIKRSVNQKVESRTAQIRQGMFWASKLTVPSTVEAIIRDLAPIKSSDDLYKEYMNMGKIAPGDMEMLQKDAGKAVAYLDFFANLNYARRSKLVRDSAGPEIFDRLQKKEELGRSLQELKGMKTVRFATPTPEFEAFLNDWPKMKDCIAKIREGQTQGIAKVAQSLNGRTVLEALVDSEGAFGQVIRDAGFEFQGQLAKNVALQARQIADKRAIEQSLEQPGGRQAMAQRLNMLPPEITPRILWETLDNASAAKWYIDSLKAKNVTLDVTPQRVADLSLLESEERSLIMASRNAAGVGTGGFFGLGERMSWLLFVSMLVCVVGISNAMLMSVTERFREIATLKCLGALDSFIMLMFVLEACFLGIVGGAFGALAGVFIGMGRMFIAFGSSTFGAVPYSDLLISMVISVFLGVVLAAVAAVYPSFKAARLAPMEAMRIE